MYRLAKAIAVEKGPRLADGLGVAGYFLSRQELRMLFAQQGFCISKDEQKGLQKLAWERQIDRWVEAGQANRAGDYVFFLQENGVSYEETAIYRNLQTWAKAECVKDVIA